MAYAIAPIARTLKAARERKGLSQRALSELAGVPQSHISRIEKGAVDLRVSSLVELARVLDLELTLVPRRSISAVRSIVRGSRPQTAAPVPAAARELTRLHKTLSLITQEHPDSRQLAQLLRQARDLQHFPLTLRDGNTLREVNRALRAFTKGTEDLDALRDPLAQLQDLRNRIVHALPAAETVKPAYSLEEGAHG